MSRDNEFDVFDKSEPLPPPPGLVGEIAEFIYNYAYRQVAEIALAGALACQSASKKDPLSASKRDPLRAAAWL